MSKVVMISDYGPKTYIRGLAIFNAFRRIFRGKLREGTEFEHVVNNKAMMASIYRRALADVRSGTAMDVPPRKH